MPIGTPARGFTMIELIIVMVLISVLSVLALPAFNSRTSVNELGMRDQLGAMLEYARKLATVQQRSVCVLVTPPTVQAVYAPAPGNVCSVASPVERTVTYNTTIGDNAPKYTLEIPADVVLGGATQIQFASDGRLLPNVTQSITIGPASVTVANETSLVSYFP